MNQQRKRPAPPQNRPSRNHSPNASIVAANRAEDGYVPPSPDERREQLLIAELRELGYTLSVRCVACGHPLVTSKSVARHLGPKCAAKAVTA